MSWFKRFFARRGRRPSIEALLTVLLSSDGASARHSARFQERIEAARALGECRDDPRVVEVLVKVLSQKSVSTYDWQLYSAVAHSLGEIGDPRGVEPLRSLLAATDIRLLSLKSYLEQLRNNPSVPEHELTATEGAYAMVQDVVPVVRQALKKLGAASKTATVQAF